MRLKQQMAANNGSRDHYVLRFQEVQHLIATLSAFAQKAMLPLKNHQIAAQQRQANMEGAGAVTQGSQAKPAHLQAVPDEQQRLMLLQQQQQKQQQQYLAQQDYQRAQKQHQEQLARQQHRKLQEQKQQQEQQQEQQVKQREQQQRQSQKTPSKQTPKQRHSQQQREKNNKPPSAPVDTKPPFALSPHRVPQYADSHAAPKHLELPVSKKAKTSQHAEKAAITSAVTASGAVTVPSPTVSGKTASPAARRIVAQEGKKPESKPQFRCASAECESRTFRSQAELDKHTNDAHAKIEDPFGFVMDCLAKALGLNQDGSVKVTAVDAPGANHHDKFKSQPTVPAITAGQTPNFKQEASTPAAGGTPMARVATQPGLRSSPAMMHLKTPQHGNRPLTPRSTPGRSTAAIPQKAIAETALPTPAPEPSSDEAPVPSPWANAALQSETLAQCFEGLDYLWGTSNLSPSRELASPALTPTSKTSETSGSGAAMTKAAEKASIPVEAANAKDGEEEMDSEANGSGAVVPVVKGDCNSAFFDFDAVGAPITLTDADALDDLCSLGLFADDDIFDFGTSGGDGIASSATSARSRRDSNGSRIVQNKVGAGTSDTVTEKEGMQRLLSMEWDQVIGANAGLEVDLPGFELRGHDMWASL